jgi:heat shock protein HslJ
MGSFTSDGRRLTVSQMAGTMMMCEPALMAQERRLLEMFRQSLAMRFDSRGRMVLTGDGGVEIQLERIV